MSLNFFVLLSILLGGILFPALGSLLPYKYQSKVGVATAVYVGLGLLAYGWVTVASASVLVGV
jgi:hypothetical protein